MRATVELFEQASSHTTGRSRRRRGATALAGLGVAALLAASCHQLVTQGRGASYAIVDRIEAASGAKPDDFGAELHSDVVTNGCIWSDPGRVTMRLALKDVGPTVSPNEPSSNNLITFDRYRVSYTRTDGRNTQGLDVPYAFDGATTFTVTPTGVTAGFQIVRLQAKLEPPLLALRSPGGSSQVISTLADVTFFGRDQTGSAVTARGSLTIHFADWGDPQGTACGS